MISNLYRIYNKVVSDTSRDNYLTRQIGLLLQNHKDRVLSDDFDILDNIQTEEEYRMSVAGDSSIYQSPTGDIKDFVKVDVEKPQHHSLIKVMERTSLLDCRFSAVTIKNFRKFSHKNSKAYGLNLKSGDAVSSAVFYGFNGCGKSSIYNGLRYLFGLIEEEDFLHYAKDAQSNLEVKVLTTSDEILSNEGENTHYKDIGSLLDAFFCNEEDIMSIGPANGENLNLFLYKALGYYEAFAFYKKLEQSIRRIEDNQIIITDKIPKDALITEQAKKVSQMNEDFQSTIEDINNLRSVSFETVENLIGALNLKLNFSYNKAIDTRGQLAQRTKRMVELNDEAEGIIKVLKDSKAQILATLPFCKQLLDYIDKTVKLFEKTLMSRHKGYHPNRLAECHKALEAISIPLINNQFVYFVDRIKRLNLYAKEDESELSSTLLKEANNLIAESNKLSYLRGEAQKVSRHKRNSLIVGDLKDFCTAFKTELTKQLDGLMSPISESVKALLADFDREGDNLKIDYEDGMLSIKYVYQDQDNSPLAEFQPHEYLNSFRLKMYGLSLKIAVAFSLMKEHKFAFPLIFDDVFYANDFFNREKVDAFFERIYDTFQKQCRDLPSLQTIFFTHDDIVFDASAIGIEKYGNCIQGKIFEAEDTEDEDIETNGPLTPYYKIYVQKQ